MSKITNSLKILVVVFSGAVVFSAPQVKATECLQSGTLEELKTLNPILILGRVEERIDSQKDGSVVELKISVQKFLNGKGAFDTVTATEIKPRHPIVGKREYELHKEYVFPVSLVGEKEKPRAELQPAGCPDLVIKGNSEKNQ